MFGLGSRPLVGCLVLLEESRGFFYLERRVPLWGKYGVCYSLYPLGYQLYSQATIDLPQQQNRRMT